MTKPKHARSSRGTKPKHALCDFTAAYDRRINGFSAVKESALQWLCFQGFHSTSLRDSSRLIGEVGVFYLPPHSQRQKMAGERKPKVILGITQSTTLGFHAKLALHHFLGMCSMRRTFQIPHLTCKPKIDSSGIIGCFAETAPKSTIGVFSHHTLAHVPFNAHALNLSTLA